MTLILSGLVNWCIAFALVIIPASLIIAVMYFIVYKIKLLAQEFFK